jgi:hypothetical protein
VDSVLPVRGQPDAFGGFCDAYEGTLDAKVCIKRLRISDTGDLERVKEVSRSRNLLLDHPLTSFEAVLQRGRGVETLEPPKYCPFQGCHVQSPSTYLRMDAWWRATGVCKKEPGRKPHESCRSIPANFHAIPHPLLRCWALPKALLISTRVT